ncbi:MAG: hypothetical protein RLZZ623_1414 [Actinomycetota bacterium]
MSAANTSAHLARSAADEWAALVTCAIIGTDRRPPAPPGAGWDVWAGSPDPAVSVLDRALAVVLARRAGARPGPPPLAVLPVVPADPRPPCPTACAVRLQRVLGGEHEVVLSEWFLQCERLGVQLPEVLVPTLLLRGRRNPGLDQIVRRLAGPRAAWLAEVVPELGVKATVAPAAPEANAPAGPGANAPAGVATDGGATVTAVVQLFADGMATWAAAPQLRQVVAGLPPSWLAALIVELSRLSFRATTERTRAELLALAEFRSAMLAEFAHAHRALRPLLPPAPPSDLPTNETDAP